MLRSLIVVTLMRFIRYVSGGWKEGKAMKGCINNYIPFSAVDGIGNRTIIFFQGCNFNCLYCHNPETIPFYNTVDFNEGYVMTPEDIVEKVKAQMPFIRGVTLSGGECTASYDFLIATVKALKAAGIHILIDTNGFLDKQGLLTLSSYVDGFMLDIKAYDRTEHIALTGVPNDKVLDAFYTLVELGQLTEVRTVVLGSMVNSKETVDKVSQMIASLQPSLPYKLIRFRKHGIPEKGKVIKTPSDEMMEDLRQLAFNNGVKNVMIL